jgi:hypothetical protein
MTKIREPLSIPDAVMTIMGGLGREEAARAAGKSATHVYRWANPDDDACVPNIEQCIALDSAYMSAGLGDGPLLRAYSAQVRGSLGGSEMRPMERLMQVVEEFGQLCGEVSAATAPGSPMGADLSSDERARCLIAASDTRAALDAMIRELEAGYPNVHHLGAAQ